MALPLYLAMTAAEISRTEVLPEKCAYMAFHFSPYSTGLSSFPDTLPPGSMLILNDRTPVYGHDPQLIAQQLQQAADVLSADGLLLDFQRPDHPETAAVAAAILKTLSCPVAVSEHYANDLDCPVFLSPPPLDCPPEIHFAPWKGRELWLEAALDSACITLTEKGSTYTPLFPPETPEPFHYEPRLFCRYHIELTDSTARFTLYRTKAELASLLEEAPRLGVTRAIGLYQELHRLSE